MKHRIRKPEAPKVLIEGYKLSPKTGKLKNVRYWIKGNC